MSGIKNYYYDLLGIKEAHDGYKLGELCENEMFEQIDYFDITENGCEEYLKRNDLYNDYMSWIYLNIK